MYAYIHASDFGFLKTRKPSWDGRQEEYFDQIIYIYYGLIGCWRLPVSMYSMFVYGNKVMEEYKETDSRGSLNISEKC
jgi:hypothetical protein